MEKDSSSSTIKEWTPSSWRKFPIKQQATYPNQEKFENTVKKVSALPPLVSVDEIERLRSQLAEVADGKRFLLQGGDCAENFADCNPQTIEKKLRIMLQMSLVLVWGARVPTVRVSRMAGQYAKPRSADTEVVEGKTYPVFRGENVNGLELTERTPDPERLLSGYFHSAATLNFARVLLAGGFGNLYEVEKWDLGFVKNSKRSAEYHHMVDSITDCLGFIETCGVANDDKLSTVDLFVSHEGLGLAYEEAMTRKTDDGKYYNVGCEMLWIGDRTRQLDHAHVEYFRGISNPIGIKVGPSISPEDLVTLIKTVWPSPEDTPGKITLITRYGASKVQDHLPGHINAVHAAGLKVIWSCDPCHGNTTVTPNGYKTRNFSSILEELRTVCDIHQRTALTNLGGVHIELTGENVTECIGGPEDLIAEDLPMNYTSSCDPRLNYAQSMEVAFLLAKALQK